MASKSILSLRTCMVRAYKIQDVASLTKAANNAEIAKWLRNTFPHPYTTEDAQNWISITQRVSPLLDFAICDPSDESVIGGIGLKARDDIHYRTMEIGYWLSEDYWHRGIATEVVPAFSEWAFDNFEHVVRLEAEVFEGNLTSCRVLQKAGFEFEGRQRAAIEKWGKVMNTMTYVKLRDGF